MNETQSKPDVNAKAEQLIIQKENELLIYTAPPTNALHGKKTLIKKNVMANESVFEYANKQGHLFIKEYEKQTKKFDSSTLKVLTYSIHLFTKQNPLGQDIKQIKREVRFKVRDYQRLRGLKNYSKTRTQLINNVNLLYDVSLKFNNVKVRDGKKYKSATLETRILTSKIEIQNGDVIVVFTPEFAAFLVNAGHLMLLPKEYFSMPSVTSEILYKLYAHARINQKRDKQRGFSIIGVESLLEAVGSIPFHEDVKKSKNRKVRERIIDPLTNGLDECQSKNLLTWEFCNAKGKPLIPEQLAGLNRNGNRVEIKSKKDKYYLKWDNFKKLYIRYTLKTPIETTAKELPQANSCLKST